MKIAILDIHYTANVASLRAIPFASLANNDRKMIGGVLYVWYVNAVQGDELPDDMPVDTAGYWVKRNKMLSNYLYVVDDAYLFATNNATDISSIETWERYGMLLEKDYMFVRNEILKLYIAKDATEDDRWDACSTEEKDVVCTWLVAAPAKRIPHVGSAADKKNYCKFGKCMIDSRSARDDAAMLEIGYMLGVQADIEDMYGELRDKIEDHKKLSKKDLKEWMNNEGDYANNGFAQKAYSSDDIKDTFNKIVVNGDY